MWGRSNNLPNITSYAEAKRTYEGIKPLRGSWDIRPLDKRSSNEKGRIKQDGDNYIIQLWQTDIVTYYPNGDVLLNTGNYDTLSTADAIGQVSPFSCWTTKGQIAVSNRYSGGDVAFLVQPKLMFKKNELGIYAPVDPPKAYISKKRVRKDVAKQVRALYKKVPEYITAVTTAFQGGVKPKVPHCEFGGIADELTEEEVVNLAWEYVPEVWNRMPAEHARIIQGNAEAAIAGFWKAAYNAHEVIEQYTVELPYGKVI